MRRILLVVVFVVGRALEVAAQQPPSTTISVSVVTKVINVVGFVTPEMRLDVLSQDAEPRVIVSNALVVKGNTRYDLGKNGEAIRSTVVTMMVTPMEAERIAQAQSQGQLTLRQRQATKPAQPPRFPRRQL
jgi:Flp pilus assembly protein CpaB